MPGCIQPLDPNEYDRGSAFPRRSKMSMKVMVKGDTDSAVAPCEIQDFQILCPIQTCIHHMQCVPPVGTQQIGLIEQDPLHATRWKS